jgi:hypothetical protein
MTIADISTFIRTLLDPHADERARVDAAHHLGRCDAQSAQDALLQVAQAEHVQDALARAAGESLALILIRKGQVSQAPLASFTGPAYLGFDEAVACHLRAQSP